MIKLRELKVTDAPFMLEWMHDSDIQKSFRRNMLDTKLEDVETFCEKSLIPSKIGNGTSLHFAIADSCDEYLGTISLKDFDIENKTAEYAISTRKKAHGKGVAYKATGLLLKKAFSEYGLHRVYLNVYSNNIPAIRLYEKCGFTFEGEFREHFKTEDGYINWKWFAILDSEFDETRFDFEE